MQAKKWTLLKCIAIPLLVGLLSSFLSGEGMEMFSLLEKPPLSPPGWLFPIVWTILYILMGTASWKIYTADAPKEKTLDALTIYAFQLVVNFLWPVFFFDFQWYLFSFFWLLLLWALIAHMIKKFAEISKGAAYLCVPYLLWVTFAGYLNLGIWWLERK